MKKFREIAFSCIGACAVMVMPLAHAQNDQGPDGASLKRHAWQMAQEIYKQLDLTDEQKKALEANKQQHRLATERVRQEIKIQKEALRGELMKLQLDSPKVNGIHDQIKSLQNQMEDEKLHSILAVRSILTPEQWIEFVKLMHKYKQEHNG